MHKLQIYFVWLVIGCLWLEFASAQQVTPDEAVRGERTRDSSLSEWAVPPLAAGEKASYDAIVEDPPPRTTTRNAHFVVSDESEHFLLRDAIKDIGGAYIGVGTNQNYEFVAWAKSKIVFLLDFDQVIVDLHGVYEVAFSNSATPDEFCDFWSQDNAKGVKGLINERFTDKAKRKRVLKAFRMSRRLTFRKLKQVKRRHRKEKIESYLNTQDQYDYIAHLFEAGRVFVLRGDLTAITTMRQIAEALTKHNRHLGVIYISNCEQYFAKLPADYRDNMLRLPVTERSLVLRTRPWLENYQLNPKDRSQPKTCANCKSRGTLLYTYMYQGFDNLRAWFEHPKTKSLWNMVSRKRTRIRHKPYHHTGLPRTN